MAPAVRYHGMMRLISLGAFAVCGTVGVVFYLDIRDVRSAIGEGTRTAGLGTETATSPERVSSVSANGFAWRVMKPSPQRAEAHPGSLALLYRLAGTFCYGGSDGADRRLAVIDNLRTREQHIVGEGDMAGEILIERIFYDHLLARQGEIREEIWLSMLTGNGGETGMQETATGIGATEVVSQERAGVTNRFGRQIGPARWVLDREALVGYYREVAEEPERMARVFDSFKPVYDDAKRIMGYGIDIEGEEDLFRDVGLRAGDVVRQVNSMPMANRRRAEYFLREFLEKRANVFVLEVEREGKQSKLIYEVK